MRATWPTNGFSPTWPPPSQGHTDDTPRPDLRRQDRHLRYGSTLPHAGHCPRRRPREALTVRHSPLRRRSPLTHNTPLVRRAALHRSSPLHPQSAKRRNDLSRRRQIRLVVFARDNWCCQFPHHLHPEVPCRGGLTPHHLRKASAAGRYVPDNLLSVCVAANTWVELEPTAAWALGLVCRTGDSLAACWSRLHQAHIGWQTTARPGARQ